MPFAFPSEQAFSFTGIPNLTDPTRGGAERASLTGLVSSDPRSNRLVLSIPLPQSPDTTRLMQVFGELVKAFEPRTSSARRTKHQRP
jgi:hypothetical protein